MLKQRLVRRAMMLTVIGGVWILGTFGGGKNDRAVFANEATILLAEKQEKLPPGTAQYKQYCQVCHGADGRGTDVKQTMPTIPDFSNGTWQKERNNVELLIGILEGKGTLMPAFNDRVSNDQGNELVAFVRAFNKSSAKPQK